MNPDSDHAFAWYKSRHSFVKWRAVTLLELIVVLAIIGGVLALLVPAVQRARESARETVCRNNLHQMRISMGHLWEARKKLPDSALPDRAGGWAVAILPFLEEQLLGQNLANNPAIQSVASVAQRRPLVMICPNGWDGESSIPPIPSSHYSFTKRENRWFELSEVPLTLRIPWIQSPENVSHPSGAGPHSGGYFLISSSGDARFSEP